jgi:hypothetical protein
MHKSSGEDFLSCGIDVSAVQLVIALEVEDRGYGQRSFPNRASGHQALIAWLQKSADRVRVCLEAPEFTVSTSPWPCTRRRESKWQC